MTPVCSLPRYSAWLLPLTFLFVLASTANAQEAGPSVSTSLYIRNDSDHTTVVTPRLRATAQPSEETRLDLVYTVDVWTSASVDIRSAATRRVTEQRDELDFSVSQQIDNVALGASYRYSTENDYESHGGSLGAAVDLAQKNTNIAVTGRAYIDKVWAAGDPSHKWDTSTATLRAALTQVIDPQMFVQVVYELTRQDGYLSSPYRFVRFAQQAAIEDPERDVAIENCGDPNRNNLALTCRGENNPDSRLRHAAAVYARRALTDSLSVGANYRFYVDDWGMSAHTAGLDGALQLGDHFLVALGYRFYTQTAADHYKPYYVETLESIDRYYTSDKELSRLSSHRLDLEISHTAELDNEGSTVRTVLLAAPAYFAYPQFPLLDKITALELTLSVEVQL